MEMTGDKLVSIIIPTYKNTDLLPDSIDSALKQTYACLEVIVVDDNDPSSKERALTEKIMVSYLSDKRVKYIKHERNKNGSAARNTGVRESKGVYIAFLDNDDIFFPNKIEMQVRCMESKDLSYGACYTGYIRSNIEGKIIDHSAEDREGQLYVEELKRNLFIQGGSNLLVRRAVYEELNGFDESFNRNQDVEFLVRLMLKYKIAYVDIVGLNVRIKELNRSKSNFIDLTEQFVNSFKDIISKLSIEEQKEIETFLNLQTYRDFLFSQKSIYKAEKYAKETHLGIGIRFKYVAYLAKRFLTHKSYGFKK